METSDTCNLHEFITVGIKLVKRYGWLSRSAAERYGGRATADRIVAEMQRPERPPITDADRKVAKHFLLVTTLTLDPGDDFNTRLRKTGGKAELTYKDFGTASVYVKKWFDKWTAGSEHQGAVGDKVQAEGTVIDIKPCRYGYGYNQAPPNMYKMIDKDGNIFVTFTGGKFSPQLGDTIGFIGTVKKLDHFNGVDQTVLTRIKAL